MTARMSASFRCRRLGQGRVRVHRGSQSYSTLGKPCGGWTTLTWLPGDDTEDNLYTNDEAHGAALTDIPVTEDPEAVLGYVLRECGKETPFYSLSAVTSGHWPIVAMACRHYRLPIPPHLWTGVLPGCGDVAVGSAAPPC